MLKNNAQPTKSEATHSNSNDIIKLKKFKEKLHNEEVYKRKVTDKIKTTKPFKRPAKDNALTEQKFKQTSQKENAKFDQNLYQLQTNYITAERHSCTTDLKCLKNIFLKDMKVNKIHRGCCIEFKTIANPFYISGMHLLVQDINGEYENLVLYNYESISLNVEPKVLIPIGTRLIIKEPHLQMFSLNENDFGIRVDSPTDVIIHSYPLFETNKPDELIEIANQSFGKSQFHTAIRLYSQAIDKSSKTSVRAYLNRSQSYIKLEKYYSAYQDAKQALKLEKNSEKAHFRMGKSAYLMRKFDLALESFEACFKLNSKNTEAEAEIKKTTERINESKTGVYNFKAMYQEIFSNNNFYMDIADYRSNKIEVTDILNKSKGVVATDFIKKGTLITACKAASAIFFNKTDYRRASYNTVHCSEGIYNTKNESENISN